MALPVLQTAIGHWSEMLNPLFSILRLEPTFARPPNQFVLLHLKKIHLMEWVRSVLAVTLGVGPNEDLPPIMLHQEVDSVWKQIREWVRCTTHRLCCMWMFANSRQAGAAACGWERKNVALLRANCGFFTWLVWGMLCSGSLGGLCQDGLGVL